MPGVVITSRGLKQVRQGLLRLRDAGADLNPILRAIGDHIENSARERFVTGKGPSGRPWKKSLRAKLQGGKTLVQDGHLRDSIESRVTGNSVEVGSNRRYAAIHQLGGVIKAKPGKALAFTLANGESVLAKQVTIPARPYLGINRLDRRAINRIIERHLAAALATA